MSRKDQLKKIAIFFIAIIELALETALFFYIWRHKYAPGYGYFIYPWLEGLLIVFYFVMTAFVTSFYGGYKFGHLSKLEVMFSQILSMCISGGVIYCVICMIERDFRRPDWLIIMTLIDIAFIVIYTLLIEYLNYRIFPPRRMILVYGDKGPNEMRDIFNSRPDKFEIAEAVHAGSDRNFILEKAKNYDGVVIHRVSADIKNELIHLCYSNNIRVYIVPSISDIILRSSSVTHLFDLPIFLTKSYDLSLTDRFLKRLLDIVCAILMLIIFSPVMLISMIAIRITDGGPVFYKQKRVTKNGQLFDILKFRSMVVDSEADGIHVAVKDDERVTPVGRVLRKVHFDELPQLINVLKGEMSMVGPRPERPEIVERYRSEIPEFDYRLKVKAGLTGYAQVYGRYNTTSFNKLKLDMMYIENYSFLLDIKLIFLTFKILFQKDNTEGFDDNWISR